MRIELTEPERAISPKESYLTGLTLAWRAFGKAIGVQVHDAMVPMDGDSSQCEPITRRHFDFEEARKNRYLSLAYQGCWDGGAWRSLSPQCTYISYSVAANGSFVDFYGWYIPKEPSRIITPKPIGEGPFLTKDQLFSMDSLIATMKLQIAQAEQEAEQTDD